MRKLLAAACLAAFITPLWGGSVAATHSGCLATSAGTTTCTYTSVGNHTYAAVGTVTFTITPGGPANGSGSGTGSVNADAGATVTVTITGGVGAVSSGRTSGHP